MPKAGQIVAIHRGSYYKVNAIQDFFGRHSSAAYLLPHDFWHFINPLMI
jgi:hypothetical protein